MQTVWVAGGAGFIGSHLCRKLVSSFKVICIDNFITGTRNSIQDLVGNPNFTLVIKDITTLDDKAYINIPKPNYIFHLASPASPNHHSLISYHKLPMETMMANTKGTQMLLEIAYNANARFLFASTSEIYGDPLEHPQKESYRGNVSTTGLRSVYDEAKRFGETLIAYYVREKNLDARIARIFNTYGPFMRVEDKRMVIDFIIQAIKNKDIHIFGNGMQTRSLCFIEDMQDGLIKFMLKDNAKGAIVNLGSEEEHTVLEFAEIIKKLANSRSKIVLKEALPQDDPLRRRADISLAKKFLKWEPKVPLEIGLGKTIEYFRSII